MELFTAPILEWETQQAHDAKPALLEYRVRLEEWELKGERLKADIRKGVITTMHDPQFDPLIQHELQKPPEPEEPQPIPPWHGGDRDAFEADLLRALCAAARAKLATRART